MNSTARKARIRGANITRWWAREINDQQQPTPISGVMSTTTEGVGDSVSIIPHYYYYNCQQQQHPVRWQHQSVGSSRRTSLGDSMAIRGVGSNHNSFDYQLWQQRPLAPGSEWGRSGSSMPAFESPLLSATRGQISRQNSFILQGPDGKRTTPPTILPGNLLGLTCGEIHLQLE
jgi:hypothetical protein